MESRVAGIERICQSAFNGVLKAEDTVVKSERVEEGTPTNSLDANMVTDEHTKDGVSTPPTTARRSTNFACVDAPTSPSSNDPNTTTRTFLACPYDTDLSEGASSQMPSLIPSCPSGGGDRSIHLPRSSLSGNAFNLYPALQL